MLPVLALHLEDHLYGARERYQLERMRDPHGPMAQALREDELRTHRCLKALERLVVAMPACPEREALAVLPSADAIRETVDGVSLMADGFWHDYACLRPGIVQGFFMLLHPGWIASDLGEMERAYVELERILVTSP